MSLQRLDVLLISLRERRERLQGVFRELEDFVLNDHLQMLWEALDERHLEPVLIVRAAAHLPRFQKPCSQGFGYLMGAQGSPADVQNGLVQGDSVRLNLQKPAHRLRKRCERPAQDVACRIRKYTVKPCGGWPCQEGAHMGESFALLQTSVGAGPGTPAREGEQFGRLGPVKRNPIHKHTESLPVLCNPQMQLACDGLILVVDTVLVPVGYRVEKVVRDLADRDLKINQHPTHCLTGTPGRGGNRDGPGASTPMAAPAPAPPTLPGCVPTGLFCRITRPRSASFRWPASLSDAGIRE